ncbi:MAG: hypothetical protein PVI71_09290 [Desulfobacterales bacterium]|jgi:hypothetical protein
MNIKYRKILEKAIDVFQKTTELKVDFHGYDDDETGYPDAMMKVANRDVELYFAVEVKLRITRATIGVFAQEFLKFQEKGMLVTRYVNPQIADLLREMDIPFSVVGATARDFILHYGFDIEIRRATQDMDLGVMVEDWNRFSQLSEKMVESELFERGKDP